MTVDIFPGVSVSSLFSIFAGCLVFYLTAELYRLWDIFKFSQKHKGRTFIPIIGNGLYFLNKNTGASIQENFVDKLGLPFNVWAGHDYYYVTSDAAEAKVILNSTKSFDKAVAYQNTKFLFGRTLLLAKYDVWKRNRKMISKCFNQTILNSFVDVFYEKSCILINILKDQNKNIYGVFEMLSLDNFFINMYRIDINCQLFPNKIITDLLKTQEAVGKRMFSNYFCPQNIWFIFTQDGRNTKKAFQNFRKYSNDVFEEKRKQFAENKDKAYSDEKQPLVDFLLDNEGKFFNEDEIFREIVLFILAATDTSGISLAFTMTLLGMNPHIQDKLLEEVKQVVGMEGPISVNDLSNLKYTERVILEGMRLLPAVPFIGRQTTSELNVGTKVIPANVNILLNIWHMHLSEKNWDEPMRFNPDRFLPEEVAKRDPYCYMPFSAGPRNCIGKTYAMMMMKTTLANVIRHYNITSGYKSIKDMKFYSCITQKTIDSKLDVNFIHREL